MPPSERDTKWKCASSNRLLSSFLVRERPSRNELIECTAVKSQHNLPSMEFGLWLSWRILAVRQPVGLERVVLVVDPELTFSDDQLE
ncbi:hypothetical protein KIN20_033964 [Parelaphostrongylus tenuis]|uniref:Uncharacterized protein n=1 Tax=Parelaphostrongylus tenuis TaxID=148309 RepID=A0AAD5R8S1_PARTN|nr:hypothetical protein KIN20_033964 [Parelaphostrongylus tenuis]